MLQINYKSKSRPSANEFLKHPRVRLAIKEQEINNFKEKLSLREQEMKRRGSKLDQREAILLEKEKRLEEIEAQLKERELKLRNFSSLENVSPDSIIDVSMINSPCVDRAPKITQLVDKGSPLKSLQPKSRLFQLRNR